MPSSTFAEHCREIAQRFLLTAVVIDDELSVPHVPPVHSNLKAPAVHPPKQHPRTPAETDLQSARPLNIHPITRGFARQGMVCGVVSPVSMQGDSDALVRSVARADIVVLDWILDSSTGENALPLLSRILCRDQPDRLRLVAVYTAEPDLDKICEEITNGLNGAEETTPAVSEGGSSGGPIDCGACRIVVHGKPVHGASKSRTTGPRAEVEESELADRLVRDFAEMVEGLLPSLVLTALGAVRENVYRMLGCFGADLDPAFLAHRACLPQPADSQQHIVEQIASELYGIMDDAVGNTSPAGLEAIKRWVDKHFKEGQVEFSPKHIERTAKVLDMLKKGFDKESGPLGLKKYHLLSQGFAGSNADGPELDRRLAHAMDFRQVVADVERQLSMGTVVREDKDDGALLLCVTPGCDSVRLTKKSTFLFLPLVPAKAGTPQIAVPNCDAGYCRMTVDMNPGRWHNLTFVPDSGRQCVLAPRTGSDQPFTDEEGAIFQWVGELKAEVAQYIAQQIAQRMSRVPLNRSEWLRRSERTGKRKR